MLPNCSGSLLLIAEVMFEAWQCVGMGTQSLLQLWLAGEAQQPLSPRDGAVLSCQTHSPALGGKLNGGKT